jgi:tetratricopeptide (TPR) repeat protein
LAPQVDWEQPPADEADLTDENVVQWLAEHPNSFWALQQRAVHLLAEQQWESAQEPLRKLIALYPEYVDEGNAYELLAQVHRGLGETDQEMQVLTELATRSADAAAAYERLTEIATERQDWSQVVENGNKYLAVYPMLGSIHRRLGQAHEALGQDEQAIESYQRLLWLEPSDPVEVHYRLAGLLLPRDTTAAKRHVLEALADAPRFRQGHRLLLQIRAETGIRPAATAPEHDEPLTMQRSTP